MPESAAQVNVVATYASPASSQYSSSNVSKLASPGSGFCDLLYLTLCSVLIGSADGMTSVRNVSAVSAERDGVFGDGEVGVRGSSVEAERDWTERSSVRSPTAPSMLKRRVLDTLAPGASAPNRTPLIRPDDFWPPKVIELAIKGDQEQDSIHQQQVLTSVLGFQRMKKYIHHNVKFSVIRIGNIDPDGELFAKVSRCMMLDCNIHLMRFRMHS